MIVVIMALGWAIVVGRFLLSPIYGGLWFLAAMTCMPRYIAIGIGQDGLAFTLYRGIIYSLFLIIVVKIVFGASPYKRLSKDGRVVFWLFVVVSVFSCFGVFQYSSILLSGGYFVEDLSVLTITVYMGWLLSNREDHVALFFRYAIVVPLGVIVLLVAFESYRQAPVLSGFVKIDDSLFTSTGREFLGVLTRDGHYRARALFSNAILLSEFAAYCLVFTFAILLLKQISRWKATVVIFCALFVIYSTGARSGLLVSALCCSGITVFYLLSFGGKGGRFATWVSIFACTMIGVVAIYFLVQNSISDRLYLIEDKSLRSTTARLQQYNIVYDLAKDSLFFGYGYHRFFYSLYHSFFTLDNYYLRIILQSGFIGFLFILIAFYKIIKISLLEAYSRFQDISVVAFVAFALALTTFIYKIFIESDHNNMYFLVLFYIVCFRVRSGR